MRKRKGERPKSRTGDELREWIRSEGRTRRIEETEPLEPVENFPHGFSWFERVAPKGRRRKPGEDSRALRALIAETCSGYERKPTPREAEAAIKARSGTGLGVAIAANLIAEADVCMLMEGEREGAWSIQDIAWWMHDLNADCRELIEWLNYTSRNYMAWRKSSVDG